MSKAKIREEGTTFFVVNGPYHKYLIFIKYLKGPNNEMAMLCIDAFTKYCAIVIIKSHNVSELALGFIECMNKMGKPPKVVYTDGETGIRHSGFLSEVF